MRFGTGSLQGRLVTDHIKIGNLTVQNYKFGIIESQQAMLDFFQFDAIVGMSYKLMAQAGVTPFFDALMQ